MGIAIGKLVKPTEKQEDTLIPLIRKLVGLAGALLMPALIQIVLHAMLSDIQMSFYDGLTGGTMGMVMIAIGIGVLVYAKKKERKSE